MKYPIFATCLKALGYTFSFYPRSFSLLLLSGLLVYWLYGEYKQVKQVVHLEESMDKMIMYIKDIGIPDSTYHSTDSFVIAQINENIGNIEFPLVDDSLQSSQIRNIKMVQSNTGAKENYKIKILDSLPSKHDISFIQDMIDSEQSIPSDENLGYGFYIRKLLPQIGFAVLLLLSTIIAYYLIWRSWSKEKQLTRFRDDFISNISHELKTPMNIIGVAIEAIDRFQCARQSSLDERIHFYF